MDNPQDNQLLLKALVMGYIYFFNDVIQTMGQLLTTVSSITFLPLIIRGSNIIIRLRPEAWIDDYTSIQFFNLFRMEKETLELLVSVVDRLDTGKLLNKRYTGGHRPIKVKLQFLIFIWYMATQDSLISIADRFKVSHMTVMKIVNRLLYFMLLIKKTYIKFPNSEEELEAVAQGFPSYPSVAGAIDGTHIFVKVEKGQQDSYTDRYRRQSINIMAICESKGLFTYAFVGFPGSAHDSRVFQNSAFFNYIERYGPNTIFGNENYHLVGDSAFGLRNWLMTPYRDNNNLTRIQRRHNYCLSAARVVIEHAFGMLKGRWRRLIYINCYNICKSIEIATAALVLHNFCILNRDLWNQPVNMENNNEEPVLLEREIIEEVARAKRDEIAHSL